MQWRSARCLWRGSISSGVREVLFNSSSMTDYLRALSDNKLTVQLLRCAWLKPDASAGKILKLNTPCRVLVREALLCGAGQPWLVGRSVFPAATLRGNGHLLRHLSAQRPLGDVLFRDPTLQRSEFEWARLGADQGLYPAVKPFFAEQALWARRSLLFYKTQPLLLTEIFLPELIKRL